MELSEEPPPCEPLPKLGLMSIEVAVVELELLVLTSTVSPVWIFDTEELEPLFVTVVLLFMAKVWLEPLRWF